MKSTARGAGVGPRRTGIGQLRSGIAELSAHLRPSGRSQCDRIAAKETRGRSAGRLEQLASEDQQVACDHGAADIRLERREAAPGATVEPEDAFDEGDRPFDTGAE